MRRSAYWLLGLLLFGSYAYFFQAGGANQNSRFDLVRALSERLSVSIDGYDQNTRDKAVLEDGRAYSDKAPGQALTAVPAVAIAGAVVDAIGGPAARGSDSSVSLLAYLATLVAAALPTVGAAVCLAFVAARLDASPGGALFAGLVYGIGTPAWAYATLLWGNALAAGCLMFAFAGSVALLEPGQSPTGQLPLAAHGGLGPAQPGSARDGDTRPVAASRRDRVLGLVIGLSGAWAVAAASRRDRVLGLVIGLSAAWAVVTEYQAAPAAAIVVSLALWHAARHGGRARLRGLIAWLGLGALGPLLVLAAYGTAAFGAPWRVGYENVVGFSGMREGVLGLTTPKRVVLQELLFGSFRGLLPLAPVLALAPVGLLWLWRRRTTARPSIVAALLVPGYYLLFNSAYYYWDGGYTFGPRLIGAALPCLVLGLAELWTWTGTLRHNLATAARAMLIALAGWGVAVTGMAVATIVVPAEDVPAPVWQLIVPAFLRGDLALNHEPFTTGSTDTRNVLLHAWNLGQWLGVQGQASVLPLLVLWLALGLLALGVVRTRREARFAGAEAGTRTPTGVLPLRPERSASANSATSARRLGVYGTRPGAQQAGPRAERGNVE